MVEQVALATFVVLYYNTISIVRQVHIMEVARKQSVNITEIVSTSVKNRNFCCRASFDELPAKYQQEGERGKEVERAILQKKLRMRQVRDFTQTIEGMQRTVTEFSPELWATLVERITVY